MSANVTLGVILTLRDQLSAGLAGARAALDRFQEAGRRLQAVGTQMVATGTAGTLAMAGPVLAFAAAEDAATRLKTAMMGVGGGIAPEFERVNALATQLGNRLPGTTADFQSMMRVLVEQGESYESILGGVGESAAYLAVQLKLPFDDAARLASRLATATGVASGEMTAFMDTIQRTANLGVSVSEMEYAFGRAAGKLKEVGAQGLASSQALAPLYANLINLGLSGETVGTGFAAVLGNLQKLQYGIGKPAADAKAALAGVGIELSLFDQAGRFRGVEAMITQLEQLKTLAPALRAELMAGIFGTGQDAQMVASIIDGGLEGYRQTAAKMAAQATLQQKVNEQLGTLKNLWDAASGTFTNTLVAWAATIAPQLKQLAEWFGHLSERLTAFIEAHPRLAQFTAGVVAFGSAALIAGGALLVVSGTAAVLLGGLGALLSPFTLLAAAGAALVALNWDALVAWLPGAAARVRELWASFTAQLPAIRARLGELWGQFAAWTAPARQALAGVWERLRAGAPGALAQAREVFAQLVAGARTAQPALAGLGRGLAGIGQSVVGFGRGFFRGFFDELQRGAASSEGFGRAADSLRGILAALAAPVQALGRWLSGLIGPTTEAGVAAQSFGERVGRAFGAGVIALANFVGDIAALRGRVAAMVSSVVSTVQGWVSQWRARIAEIVALAQEIPAAFARLPDELLRIGAQLIEGLWRGIQAKWEEVKAKVAGIASSIASTVKGALGIESPSRIFAGIGQNVMAGLALGLQQRAGTVLGEVRGLAQGLVAVPLALAPIAAPALPGMPAPWLPDARVDSRLTAPPAAGTPAINPARGGQVGGAPVIHFSPTINITGGAGGAGATKQAVQDAMQLSLRELERLSGELAHTRARRAYA
jgi:TP901 family phage tail tape measure protein